MIALLIPVRLFLKHSSFVSLLCSSPAGTCICHDWQRHSNSHEYFYLDSYAPFQKLCFHLNISRITTLEVEFAQYLILKFLTSVEKSKCLQSKVHTKRIPWASPIQGTKRACREGKSSCRSIPWITTVSVVGMRKLHKHIVHSLSTYRFCFTFELPTHSILWRLQLIDPYHPMVSCEHLAPFPSHPLLVAQ